MSTESADPYDEFLSLVEEQQAFLARHHKNPVPAAEYKEREDSYLNRFMELKAQFPEIEYGDSEVEQAEKKLIEISDEQMDALMAYRAGKISQSEYNSVHQKHRETIEKISSILIAEDKRLNGI